MSRLVKGRDLTPDQVSQVKRGYEQVRPERGGHFYSNGHNWRSATIVGSDDKYVKGA